jgi:hypothetical protein
MRAGTDLRAVLWAGVILVGGVGHVNAGQPDGVLRHPQRVSPGHSARWSGWPYAVYGGGFRPYRSFAWGTPYVEGWYGSPYGIYYNPGAGQVEYYLPPVFAPAELGFGPQAVKRFLGLDPNAGLGPLAREHLPAPEVVRPPAAAAEANQPPPPINLAARARARKAIGRGDDQFRKQRFHEALQEYRFAALADPHWAEVFFRQGHAWVAMSRFDSAATAFKRALALRPPLDRDGFRLQDLYADNAIAKTAHLEVLARNALQHPQDTDAFFLVGLFLHYDGQAARAEKFFARAKTLAGADDAHLRPFLPEAKPGPAVLAAGVDT